jgi:hypothetical protein
LVANVSRMAAKKAGFYNFGCKRVLLTVEFLQSLPELDLQGAEGRRRLWPTRMMDLFSQILAAREAPNVQPKLQFWCNKVGEVKNCCFNLS